MAKKKAEKPISNASKEKPQIKIDFEGETFLWDGIYYANTRTGLIAPTRVRQKLDDIRLKGDAELS